MVISHANDHFWREIVRGPERLGLLLASSDIGRAPKVAELDLALERVVELRYAITN